MLRVTTAITGGPGGSQWSTHYFGGSTSGEAVVAAQAVRNFWAELANVLRIGHTFNPVDDVDLVDPATGLITGVFPTTTAVVNGTAADTALPWATQGLIRWRTGDYVNGREIRGRTFIPGFTEAAQVSGSPDATTITKINGAGDILLAAASGAGDLVVYSPTHRVASEVTSRSAWSEWAVLRSRRS